MNRALHAALRCGATFLLTLSAGACDDLGSPEGITASAALASASTGDVPPRGAETKHFHYGVATDTELWAAAARRDSSFTVGLKAPGKARGNYRQEQEEAGESHGNNIQREDP